MVRIGYFCHKYSGSIDNPEHSCAFGKPACKDCMYCKQIILPDPKDFSKMFPEEDNKGNIIVETSRSNSLVENPDFLEIT